MFDCVPNAVPLENHSLYCLCFRAVQLAYPSVADDRIGSRLWLLRRVKLTSATQRDAEFYVHEALQWLLDVDTVL